MGRAPNWFAELFLPRTRTIKAREVAWRRRVRIGVEQLEDRMAPAVFTVNTNVDTVDVNPGDGVAADSQGLTSLRAAVMEANALAGADTINLPAGTYLLTRAGSGEGAAATGDLDVTGDLTIFGSTTGVSEISAQGLGDRIFDLPQGASLSNQRVVNFDHLKLTGGVASGSDSNPLEDHGGALRIGFYNTVTITNTVFLGNSSPRTGLPNLTFGLGGAIGNDGFLTLLDCRFESNSASNGGGAIYAGGTPAQVGVRNCTFSNNSARDGGAIKNHEPMTIDNSTFSGNQAVINSGNGQGGAIDNNGGGNLTLTNCTLSGNTSIFGGAIVNFSTLTAKACTIAGNSAAQGGGINASSGTVLENTIVALNTASSSGPDVLGTVQSSGHNLVGNTANSNGFNAALGDLLNVNPLLGALADNGGPTQTRALLTGSPAIDAANTTTAPATDQRGVTRPQGPAADIGAFEFQAVNGPPVANNQSVSTNEDTTLNGAVTATDPEGDPLSYALVSGPTHGMLTLNSSSGAFAYTPAANSNGADSFTFRANDGQHDSNDATVSITVTPVNDAPLAADDAYSVNQNQTLTVIAAPGVTSLVMHSQAGDYIGQGQNYNYTAATGVFSASRNSDDGVSFSYLDNLNAIAFWFLDFAAPFHATLVPGTYLNATRYPFQASNVPGMDVSGEGRGSNTLTGNFTVNRAIYETNGKTQSFDATFEQHSEGAPPALFGEINYNSPNAPAGVLHNDSDADNDPLTTILVTGPAHGSLTLNADGSFSYTPALNFSGTDSFTYMANDGALNSNVATVSITVNHVNQPPVAADDSYTTGENTALVIAAPGVLANDSDADSDALTAILASGPSHGSLQLNSDGSFSYTPAAGYRGGDNFTYRANDGNLSSSPATVSLTVSDHAPLANDDAYAVNEDAMLTVTAPGVLANDTDADQDPLRAILASFPAHGAVALKTDGSFFYTPNAGYFGSDSFTYRAHDGTLYSGVATVNITINHVNHAPVAVIDAFTVNENQTLTALPGVLSNDSDSDGDPLTALLVALPAHGSLALDPNGSFTYTPAQFFHGVDSFTYMASDGVLNSNVATVSITVNPVNQAPSFVKGADQATDQGAGPQAVPGWATAISAGPPNEANQVLSFQIRTDNDTLFAALPAVDPVTGALTYTPSANFHGIASVTVAIHDNGGTANGGSDTSPPQTFTITVNPPPRFSLSGSASANLQSTYTLGLSTDDPNPVTSWTITWGDGSVQTLPGNPSSVTHIYTSASSYVISATATDSIGVFSASNSLDVTVYAVHLSITAPTSTTAGDTFAFTVKALDPFGNAADGYLGTVQFTTSIPYSYLPNDYTFTEADGGSHSFTASIVIAETQTLTATDTNVASITGGADIAVKAGAFNALWETGFPSPTTAGVAHTLTVTALDRFGNIATSFRGIVSFESQDRKASLPASYTFTAADAGVHNFSVTLRTAGNQYIMVATTVSHTIYRTYLGYTVTAAAATHFRITAQASATANLAFSFLVTALDEFGNVATGYRGRVHHASSDPRGKLPANYTFTGSDNGMHTFTVIFKTRGLQSILITDTSTGSPSGSALLNVKINPKFPVASRRGLLP
ncbi:MAG: tandem-95 repeat protein [Planctomycetes bacterium]|nr:tandem-95 repeat protein [Planctomycetota bacterium]